MTTADTLTLRKYADQHPNGDATRYSASVDGAYRSMQVAHYSEPYRRLMGEKGRWVCRWTDWQGNLRTVSADTAAELAASLGFARVSFSRPRPAKVKALPTVDDVLRELGLTADNVDRLNARVSDAVARFAK
jgi:hypothetical protein